MRIKFISNCKDLGLSLWQCPQFLFLVMGVINIASTIFFYFLGQKYIDDPRIIALVVSAISAILFVISYVITRSLEDLVEVNRLKKDFSNIVSHQLRAPITNLKWLLESAEKEKEIKQLPSSCKEYFGLMEENIQRMENLINDLVIVAKIKNLRAFPKRSFELNKAIGEVVKNFTPLIDASNLKIELDFNPDKIEIRQSQNLLRTVIENLLDNAIRYNKPKGRIRITTRNKGRNKTMIEIKDTGIGIPDKSKQFLFQRFFRASNAIEKDPRGSGLGLFIVKTIVNQLGGKIYFSSKLGEGTTFKIILPKN